MQGCGCHPETPVYVANGEEEPFCATHRDACPVSFIRVRDEAKYTDRNCVNILVLRLSLNLNFLSESFEILSVRDCSHINVLIVYRI